MKVVVASNHEYAGIIQDILGDDAEVITSSASPDSILEKGKDVDIIASNRVPSELIESSSRLKMIQTFSAGVDNIDFSAIQKKDDLIICNSHINAAEVAEYAITLLLAVAKNIIPNDKELRKGNWVYAFGGPNPNVEIRKKTCLIVGLGNIGSEIAKRLRGFDVTIQAATQSGMSKHAELVEKLVKIDEVKHLIKEADFIILSLPLTPDSKGLVNEEFISQMKPSSILVNISRGPIIEEKALFDALRENKIRGAGLDVWWRYPTKWRGTGIPPSDIPFQDLENLVASPHRAGYSENTEREYFQFAGENILRFIQGKTPLNVIDSNRGY
ncbi:MAG: 2-hydroxyacid dehydrogenase [Candidatus Thorarchaeota archaeon]